MNDAVSITRDLVRCPSVTPADAGALGVLERLLKDAGFEVHRVTFGEPGTADIDNLYARIGDSAPHITFAGHTDVVPPGDETAWTLGAFSGEVKDGFLYGRGAVDMKGGIACSVAAVLDYLKDNGGKPKGSISFLITGDEEDISVNGTIKLLKWCAERGEKFDHCVLGEPSNVEVLGDCIKIGRRGSQSGTLYVDGVQGHVAYPHRAANPVPDISRLIVALSDEPLDHGSAQFQASNLEFTSVDVGNTAGNVIPGQARAKFNIRFNDNHTQETLRTLVEERLTKACGNRIRARIVWEYSNSNVFVTKPGAFTDLAVGAIEEVTGRKPELSTSGGTSDARFISSYCPVIEFGLVGQTMHQIDERTPVSDLEKLTKIYRGVLERYFGWLVPSPAWVRVAATEPRRCLAARPDRLAGARIRPRPRDRRAARLILHPHQIQSVRRCDGAAGGAVAGGECGGEVVGAPAAFADPDQRAHHRAYLAVQERARGSQDRNRVALSDDIELVERLLRRFRLAFGIAKRREIVLAEQALGSDVHRVRIEMARHAPASLDIEREIGAVVGDAVAVVASLGRETRLEIIRHDFRAEHADRMRPQMRVQPVAQAPRRKRLFDIAMRDLRQRVHAGIGAARAMDANLLAADRLHRGFQRALHGRSRCPGSASPRTACRHIR